MKEKFLASILILLVLFNILDGDFSNPSFFDWIKFVLMLLCFIILIFGGKYEAKRDKK
jgi:hypothetical protein